jgi:CheY-like chemotaxis protein
MHKPARILLVEDDPNDAELTISALTDSRLGNGVVVVHDGLEVLKQVKSDPNSRAIPIVVLTSSREEQDLVRSYDLGTNAYVVKPLDFRQFMDAVRELGLFWAVLNEPPPASTGDRQ